MKQRSIYIDLLRVIAIFLMLMSHSTMILNSYGWSVNSILKDIANYICFSLFLIGLGYGIGLNLQKQYLDKGKILKKILTLYLSYAIISISQIFYKGSDFLGIIRFLLFIDLPSYAEFLVSFGIYMLVSILLPNTLKKLTKTIYTSLLFGVIFFVLGMLLAILIGNNPEQHIFEYILKIFTGIDNGKNNIYSFPVFQYSVFFLIGITFGRNRYNQISVLLGKAHRQYLILALGSIFSGVLSIFIIYFIRTNGVNRWPPDITYILGNSALILSLASLIHINENYFISRNWLREILYKISSKSVLIVTIHIPLLYLLVYALGLEQVAIAPLIFTTMILLLSGIK